MRPVILTVLFYDGLVCFCLLKDQSIVIRGDLNVIQDCSPVYPVVNIGGVVISDLDIDTCTVIFLI